jgi:hypothetical protein
MKNILFLLAILTLFTCKKESETLDADFYIIPHPQYQACDTTLGYVTAIKNSRVWVGGAYCYYSKTNDTKRWTLVIEACNAFGDTRERLVFGSIYNATPIRAYEIKVPQTVVLPFGQISSSFATLLSDGDVLENLYRPDTTSHKNVFTIDKWNETTKEAEGSFSVTYNLAASNTPTGGAKQFRIHSGKFRVTIPD